MIDGSTNPSNEGSKKRDLSKSKALNTRKVNENVIMEKMGVMSVKAVSFDVPKDAHIRVTSADENTLDIDEIIKNGDSKELVKNGPIIVIKIKGIPFEKLSAFKNKSKKQKAAREAKLAAEAKIADADIARQNEMAKQNEINNIDLNK